MDASFGANSANQVEIFINAFDRAMRARRTYNYSSGQSTLDTIYENAFLALDKSFFSEEVLDFEIRTFEILHNRRIVYDNKERKTSLSFQLHQDGIRMLSFKRGMTREELREVLECFATDFSRADQMDNDLYCLLAEKNFTHLQVIGADLLSEAFDRDAALKSEFESFKARLSSIFCDVKVSTPRKLRSEDLRILEEFRLNPTQFVRSNEEIAGVIQGMLRSRDGLQKERETLERLLLMGFHFLVHESDVSQVGVGRELVTKVATVALGVELFDLFLAVIQRINTLQKEKIDRAGECQKILDSLFHVDQLPTFVKLLEHPETDSQVIKILQDGPSSAVRLMILILGARPQVSKNLQDFILKNLSSHMSWVMDEVTRQPQSEAWEQLINLMSQKPNVHFQKFLEVVLARSNSAVKLKIMRQLAQLGTPDSLKVFDRSLKSSQAKERMGALEILSTANSKAAIKILKDYLDSPSFLQAAPDERELGYSTIARLGGELSFPYFEKIWKEAQSGGFIFKRSDSEKRLVIARALGRAATGLLQKFLNKLPAEEVTEEIKSFAAKVIHQPKGEKQS